MKLNKFVAGAALVAALGLGSIATTQTVEAAGGTVHMQSGNKMVGMWVHVDGGQSGWAKWWHKGGDQYGWSYNTQGKTWTADVGVNGTRDKWKINAKGFNWTNKQDGNIDIWVNQDGHYGWRTTVPQ